MATLNFSRSSSFLWLATISQRCIFRSNLDITLLAGSKLLRNKSNNIDVLDIFTNRFLLENNSNKTKPCESQSAQVETPQIAQEKRSQILKKIASQHRLAAEGETLMNISEWAKNEIDNYVTIVMDCNDKKTFQQIFKQIIQLKKLPSDTIIIRILCFMCDDSISSMDNISQLVDVCREINVEFYARSMEFAPFLAQYLWNTDRFDDALSTLNEIFPTSNKSVKSSVLRNYRQIIFDAIQSRDEEIVTKLVQSAEQIYNRQKSPVILVYVWADCFYSVLFRNQEIANEIFESYEAIRKIVSIDIGWIVLSLVQQHNIDGLHRLIEQCLKFNMKSECATCMRALFDYHRKYWNIYVK